VEADLWQHYNTVAPGKVMVVGADIWNGTTAELQNFRNITGATFPLLLNGGLATGGNVLSMYGDRDNYVIIDEHGIVRFSARAQGYNYGEALDLPRMQGLIDSLLSHATGVGDPSPASGMSLSAAPNPGRAITLRLQGADLEGKHARIEVLDLTGRRIVALYDGPAGGAVLERRWDGQDAHHATVAPGVYWVRAQVGDRIVTRRIALLR
jgi:hypothetical protein